MKFMKVSNFMQKMKDLKIEDISRSNFYHICTDGTNCPTIMLNEEDFRTAHNYLALTSWKLAIPILCYCIMSNHLHVLVMCNDRTNAGKFIRRFKQVYSIYLRCKYGMKRSVKGINESICIISDIQYLRRCIAYILRNPISAKMCRRIEDYPWSSYPCHFCNASSKNSGKKVSELNDREKRAILKTGINLKDCPLILGSDGTILDGSFIRTDLVEMAFMGSGKAYLSYLGHCNDSQMEYDLAYRPLIRTNDSDLISACRKLAEQWFSGKEISQLNSSEKCRMVKNLYFNNKTSIPQLSRILGLPKELVRITLSQ